MNGFSLWTHLAALVALVINLWVAGDLVEAWIGHGARNAFELALILAYAVFVLGILVPLRFWREPDEERRDDRRE
jgi:hypothetical protein